MSTVDDQADGLVVSVKGAPEEVMARVTRIGNGTGEAPVTSADRAHVAG